MRLNHQRGIERRQAEVTAAVREWARADGWEFAVRGNALHKTIEGKRHRLYFGVRNIREQVWTERGYQNAGNVTGAWTNLRSCPWSLVRVESGQLFLDTNISRPDMKGATLH